jgi:hypothetical protein
LEQLLGKPHPEPSHFAGVKGRMAQEARDLATALANSLSLGRNTSSDWGKVDTDLAFEGKITTDVPSDGNCLYASVSLAIRELGTEWAASRVQELEVRDLGPYSLRLLTAQQLTLSPEDYRDALSPEDYAKSMASVPAEIWAGAPPEGTADDVPGDEEYRRWARGHVFAGVFACHVCITALCSALQLRVRVTGRNLLGERLVPVVCGGAVWSDRRDPQRPSGGSRCAPAGREPRLQPLPRSAAHGGRAAQRGKRAASTPSRRGNSRRGRADGLRDVRRGHRRGVLHTSTRFKCMLIRCSRKRGVGWRRFAGTGAEGGAPLRAWVQRKEPPPHRLHHLE